MVYLGFGSNLGDRLNNIHQAYEYVSYFGEIIQRSPVYESPAMIYPGEKDAQGDYLNSVISFETHLSPHALLHELKSIEAKFGIRDTKKWSARYMDIDILLYNDLVLMTETLKIPHPELFNRNFVLKPLFNIAPELKIPGENKSAADLLLAVQDSPLKFFYEENGAQ